MKTFIISCLLTTLLTVAFVQAQDFIEQESSAKRHRFLRPGFDRHFDKVEIDAFHQKFFRSQEDSLGWMNPAPPLHKWKERWEAPLRERGFMGRGTPSDSRFSLTSRQAQNVSGNIQETWMRHYGSGLIPAYDVATAMTSDALGNVYVTGYSTTRSFGDYFTAKYNAAGVQVWSARYNGAENGEDWAFAIAVDVSGNVYVTGYSYASDTNYDYATIKYNSAGAEEWVARYNGPGNFDDYAIALAVDAASNVYVTGRSMGSGTHYDYATVKYNGAGAPEWVARYNGPGNADDVVYALAVDDSGNVLVTGYSYGADTGSDYATIKYNNAGAPQWIARYNGSGNSDFGDGAFALAVDDSGNVYVTGAVYGSLTGYDYVTVKYNGAGAEQWIARYNGPGNPPNDYARALTVDDSGNVYVTGYSGSVTPTVDYATIKYNGAGAEQWVARYNGPEDLNDAAYAIAVDVAGNVYVAGYSEAYSKYDYATIKYNSAGALQWVARYNGPGNGGDDATAITVDPAGNIYVTGYSYDADTDYDYATVKYDGAGAPQWVARYNGLGNSNDHTAAIAVDPAGNIYVTGYSYNADTKYDYATVKYNAAGTEQWVARYNGPGNSDDHATAIAVDPSGGAAGAIYVTGYSSGSGPFFDYATIQYNSAGAEQWVARYNGPGDFDDYAIALAIDPAGGAAGAIYVTGYSYGSGTGDDYATIKYDGAGEEQWVARYNGSGNSSDRAAALAVDPAGGAAGAIYVTGWSSGPGADYGTVKYNAAGAEQWVARYSGPVNDFNFATALAIDPVGGAAGAIYVTGYSVGSGTSGDYATIKYNAAGAEQWVARSDGPGHPDDYAHAIAVDHSGNVYVTGSSHEANSSWAIYTTIKYSQGSLASSVKTITSEVPAAFELGSNYPNPFWSEATSPAQGGGNSETTIQYAIPAQTGDGEHVTLRIYNLQGQLVRTLVDEQQSAGRHRVVWDGKTDAGASVSSGVYLYTITAGNFKAAKKMAILK